MALAAERVAHLVKHEKALLAGLEDLERAEEDGTAVETVLETEDVHVPAYGGRPGFSFPVRRLTPEGYEQLVKRHTRPVKPGEPATFRRHDYLCDVIIEATTEEAQLALWRNRARLARYKAATPIDLVRTLIPKAGWREAICRKIDELGGYEQGQAVTFGPTNRNKAGQDDPFGSGALDQDNDDLEQTLGE